MMPLNPPYQPNSRKIIHIPKTKKSSYSGFIVDGLIVYVFVPANYLTGEGLVKPGH